MSVAEVTTYAENAESLEGDSLLTIGGLTIRSWQLVIWILAGAIFCGILLALAVAYVNYRRERTKVIPESTYPELSVAAQRERMMSAVKDVDLVEALTERQRQRSLMYEKFLKSKRTGRRMAFAGSSMEAEAGSFLRNPWRGSLRSGVSGVSTPHDSDDDRSPFKFDSRRPKLSDSMIVELGEEESSPESVRSGVTDILTPRGSFRDTDNE